MLRTMSTSYLPEAMVENIFSRLPPKSLIRFRSVSKTWFALIGTPDFLSKNILNHSILVPNNKTAQNPNPPFLLVAYDNQKPIFNFLSYDTLDCLFHVQLNIPSPVSPDLQIVASSHGLLCLYDLRFKGVYLWNPTTSSSSSSSSSSRLEPLPPVSPRPNRHVDRLDTFSVGFGFDPISNDFKVVRLVRVVHNKTLGISNIMEIEAEVCSVSSGSWRQVDPPNIRPFTLGFNILSTTYMNGVFFWLTRNCIRNWTQHMVVDDKILAFDFSEEVFKTTPLPEIGYAAGTYSSTLTVLNSFVALMVIQHSIVLNKFDIWVLLEFGVEESWNKLITITISSSWGTPLGFWKNRELFMENSQRQLVLYDPFTKTQRNLGQDSFPSKVQVVPYTPNEDIEL